MQSTIEVARELFSNYDSFKLVQISSRRFKHADMTGWLQSLRSLGLFTMTPAGVSAEGRTIPLLTFGRGNISILLWSQMHGDEPTATMALLDMLNFLSRRHDHPVTQAILENLSVSIVPMLNPDGAERFQRRTAQEIDMNRDALQLETPEARLLKDLQARIQPRFGFNLHDQDPRYTVGSSTNVSTIALLAPAFDDARSVNDVRRAAKQVAAMFAQVMAEFIPGHVSKYDDSFEPRAFGDNVQKWGTSTVLVESGGWPHDRDKMFIRKLNYTGLLTCLYAIATGQHQNAPVEPYDNLPFGTKYLFDVILRGAELRASESARSARVDIGINIDEILDPATGLVALTAKIMDVGDLSIFGAFREFRMNGRQFQKEEVRIDRTFPMEELEKFLQLGTEVSSGRQ